MKKYRKKPVIVEAVQWFKWGDNTIDDILHAPENRSPCNNCEAPWYSHADIDTLEGTMRVCPGDWIIKGVKGEYYPCKPDIFETTYEEIKQ